MEHWELVARERIRDTLARYTWAGDHLRLAELTAAFTEDGVLEARGRPPAQGRAAIAELIAGVGEAEAAPSAAAGERAPRRIVRHSVTNVRFVEVTRELARVESYFTVLTEIGLDHHGRYRDELVPAGDEWLIRHRRVSTDWSHPASTMA